MKYITIYLLFIGCFSAVHAQSANPDYMEDSPPVDPVEEALLDAVARHSTFYELVHETIDGEKYVESTLKIETVGDDKLAFVFESGRYCQGYPIRGIADKRDGLLPSFLIQRRHGFLTVSFNGDGTLFIENRNAYTYTPCELTGYYTLNE